MDRQPRTSTGRITPVRRSHRKSRKGCAECKRRHIRCDERQPTCANCEVAERICVFSQAMMSEQPQRQGQGQGREATAAPPPPGREVSDHGDSKGIEEATKERVLSPLSIQMHNSRPSLAGVGVMPRQISPPASLMQQEELQTPSSNCCPGLSDKLSTANFTLQHLIIMRYTDTVPNLTGPYRSAVDIALRYATDAPYLIDEVLAFTAFHMVSIYPGSSAHLQRLATELQSRALASFTRLTEMASNDDQATAVPKFLFSAILGRHVLADTLTHCGSDFHILIDRFVRCFELNRGIRAVITPTTREFLHQSEMQPFFHVVSDAEQKIGSPGNECDALGHLMDSSDLNEASVKSCRQAIEVLQWAFDLCRNLDEEEYPQAASAFFVRVETGFVDVLRKHRPEALAIIAYYGILLYRCRVFWAFRDAGAALVHAISGQLGGYWKDVLGWPLHVLEIERES